MILFLLWAKALCFLSNFIHQLKLEAIDKTKFNKPVG